MAHGELGEEAEAYDVFISCPHKDNQDLGRAIRLAESLRRGAIASLGPLVSSSTGIHNGRWPATISVTEPVRRAAIKKLLRTTLEQTDAVVAKSLTCAGVSIYSARDAMIGSRFDAE